MEYNIKDLNNTQYFSVCTYYVVPFCKGSKIWIFLAFKKSIMKTLLFHFFIKNENKETITKKKISIRAI